MLTTANRFLLGPWVESYKSYQKKIKQPVDIDRVPRTSIRGGWFGDKHKAKTILVYYHGGGHALPGLPVYLPMLTRMVGWCDGNLAIFSPGYTCTPNAQYPQAFGELVEALRFVLEGVGKDKEILLGGDSAGGQLVLAVLSHLSGHPHPDSSIVKPLTLDGRKIRGVFTLAPWVSSDVSKFPSFTEHAITDTISPKSLKYWEGLYKNGKPDDEYIVPEMAAADWWSGMSQVTDNVLVTCGNDEALRDAIKSFFPKFQQGVGKERTRLLVADGESHDEPVVQRDVEFLRKEVYGQEKTQEGAILNWLKKYSA